MKSLKLNLEELSDILEVSTIISTENCAGMQVHSIEHLTIGRAITVKPCGDGALVIWGRRTAHYVDFARVMQWLEHCCDCGELGQKQKAG
ncbi:MAG: hypothetical protein HOP36_08640 [Methyloglobulus sp.]|nr:hypothetical protein [Methyloglobulus sp.]